MASVKDPRKTMVAKATASGLCSAAEASKGLSTPTVDKFQTYRSATEKAGSLSLLQELRLSALFALKCHMRE